MSPYFELSIVSPYYMPETVEELVAIQGELAGAEPAPWPPSAIEGLRVGGCVVCFAPSAVGPGKQGDAGYVGAAVFQDGSIAARATTTGAAGWDFEPGLLALREGRLLEATVRALSIQPDILLVNATGRDHPRRAGLALHMGAVLGMPTIGVTRRPLIVSGAQPAEGRGSHTPLLLDGACIAFWLRTRTGKQPLVVHAGWRVDAETAVEIVLAVTAAARTPEPLREARRLARTARATALLLP